MIRNLAHMARYCLIVLVFIAYTSSFAQIVNVESKRMEADTTGWLGSTGLSFTYIKNVQEVISANASAHVQYQSLKNLYLLIGNYNLLKGNNQKLSDNMFYHFRYNRTLSPVLLWEVFVQWQQDVVSNIAERFLAGSGPRFTLHQSEKIRLNAGTAAMYEYEEEKTAPAVTHTDIRSSSYLAFTYKPSEVLQLVNTTLYQPLFNHPADFRVLNQSSLNIKASKKLAVSINWNYLYDASPAANSPMLNFSITNGLTYRL